MTDPNEIKINYKKVEKNENAGVAITVSPVSYNLETQWKARFCNRREDQTASYIFPSITVMIASIFYSF